MFFKNIKSRWRRPVALGLALAVAAGTVDLRPFLMTSYAYSKDYGICTDNHLYSTAGANCKADEYVMTTKQTKDLIHGSPEWKEAIERNKQVLKEQIGWGDERTVLKTLWAAIDVAVTHGSAGLSPEAIAEARYWEDYIRKNIEDSVLHNYWTTIPTRFSGLTEDQLGIVRHEGNAEATTKSDPLLYALCDYEHLFPSKGQSIANAPGEGWTYDAHWLMPRMGTGWLESYTPEKYGEQGVVQWPLDSSTHEVVVNDQQKVSLEMVQQNALDMEHNKNYWSIGKLDSKGYIIMDGSSSSGSGNRTDSGDTDTDTDIDTDTDTDTDTDDGDDSGSSNVKKNKDNHYYINMTENFFQNASVFKVYDDNVKDFVPLSILSEGSIQVNGWTVSTHNGWNQTAHYIEIQYNGSGTPQPLYGYFEIPKGSFVSKENVTWDSPMDFAADVMEVYKCARCPSNRRPTDKHQTFIKIHELRSTNSYPCFMVGGVQTDPNIPEPDVHFCTFRHQEDWQSDYNVQLNKYDYETGEPLQNSVFELYEKFDDQDQVNQDTDGAVELYEGDEAGEYPDNEWQSTYTSSPVVWDNFRKVGSMTTDANGHIETDVPKNYHYEKTYCDGHPAPQYVAVPEKEYDDHHNVTNQPAIDRAKAINKSYSEQWIDYYEDCIAKSEERAGVHFHWLSDAVDEGEIRSIAGSGGEEGETPNAGPTACFGKEESYESSGCKQDTEDTYQKFISLKYTYTWKEATAREGYILHDTHTDDVLIEAITTDSSQNGANSTFAIGDEKYDKYITINEELDKPVSGDAPKDDGKSVTLLSLMTDGFGIGDGEEDSESAMEATIRDGYDFEHTGFSAFKETVLNAVRFLTGNVATPSTATDSESDDDEQDDDTTYLPDIDLSMEEDGIPEFLRMAVNTLKPMTAYAAETATQSEADETDINEARIAPFMNIASLQTVSDESDGSGSASGAFESVFLKSFTELQTDDFGVELGPDDNWSHCNDRDGEGNAWRVYDHRTEGEIHFNKRDLDLKAKESGQYDAYADENGDGTLEGAVYGLFAAENIKHPDGKTNVVFQKNDLVAVATTDRNGDGSFQVITEAPGIVYDYKSGKMVETDWYAKAPKNRFRDGAKAIEEENHAVVNDYHQTDWTVDDYTDDKDANIIAARTERLYDNNEKNNGNSWIGRPLILGEYYIRELSRSEGYELSVNGKANLYSNYDANNPDAAFAIKETEDDGPGHVEVSRQLYINGQESVGAENEPFFTVASQNMASNGGFDIVVSKLPEGTRFYRQDSNTTTEIANIQTGWEVIPKTDANGNIIYKKAESDTSDIKYGADGKPLTVKTPVTTSVGKVAVTTNRTFSQSRIDESLKGSAAQTADGTTYYPDQIRLAKEFTSSDWRFVKMKLETALRAGAGMVTPSAMIGGQKSYSSETLDVYSWGVRKGETDRYGVSGVNPGEVATKTVYGPQIVKVTLNKTVNGVALTEEDLIRNLLQWYIDHPQYSFGGLDSYTVKGDTITFGVYAYDAYPSGDGFVALSKDGNGYEIYIRKPFVPDDTNVEPYYVYVKYTETGSEDDAFGYYTNLKTTTSGSITFVSALCTPDASISGDGTISARMIDTPQYYKKGETVYDENGEKVPETIHVKKYEDKETTVVHSQWNEVTATYDAKTGNYVIHVDVPYTDSYGVGHTDADSALEVLYKAVCPEGSHTLTQDDLDAMSSDERDRFAPGDRMSCGLYETDVLKAKAFVYKDYAKKQEINAGTYVVETTLTYPGQDYTFQDGDGAPSKGTIQTPVGVEERSLRQKIRIDKDIQKLKESKSVWYCLNCGYENADGDAICGFCGHNRTTEETKTIDYAHDTYGAVHSENISADREDGWYETAKDWFAKLLKLENKDESTESIGNFRFKAYLKSNLERLYRKADGTITWVDRNGNEMIPQYEDKAADDGNYDTFTWKYKDAFDGKTVDFPEKDKTSADGTLESSNVQKIYTEVEHNKDSRTSSARANNVWASYGTPQGGNTTDVGDIQSYTTSERGASGEAVKDNSSLYSYNGKLVDADRSDKLNDTVNSGYTRILESTLTTIEDEGTTREVETYNYEKFFDAIHAANTDIWDDDMHSTYTGDAMKNYPGQHWFETFYEKYQKDDTDPDHTKANTDGADKDNTAGGDKDTSFKPFRWIRERVFGYRDGYEKYPADNNGVNTEVTANTSDLARANAEASDAVRQFAVKWYLQDEAAKLMVDNGQGENVALKGGTIGYDEAVYDEALFNAIAKAYNYLKPFYFYDLDTIYSVEWDSAKDGGADQDYTTLSADELHNGTYYNTSSYLPYGVYVIVEQQPERRDKDVNDWKNRSYDIEKPKEVIVPSVYDAAESNDTSDNYDPHYNFDTDMSLQKQAKASNYLIRFGEELSDNTENQDEREFVIRAHGYYGDFEVYKYGLDIDGLSGTIMAPNGAYGYHGWELRQGYRDPLKDYYEYDHRGEAGVAEIGAELGGNNESKYHGYEQENGNGKDTANGETYDGDILRKRFFYASVSEDDGIADNVLYKDGAKDDNNASGMNWKDDIPSTTGELTAYDKLYSAALVPWSVTAPADLNTYSSKDFTGYADVKERNSYYVSYLRINKVDSETGEYILHDDAIFGLYAASRYTSFDEIEEDAKLIEDADERARFLMQFKPGDAKFYLKDTYIVGSKEFLEAMGATDLQISTGRTRTPIVESQEDTGHTYTGLVRKGTPVCVESERIDLSDDFGKKTGQMTVWSTKADVKMDDPVTGELKDYGDQTVGYFKTSQPVSAGVYVLAEIKPPAGYARSKPVAIEVYSDETSYYVDGDMYAKVAAVRYDGNLLTDIPYEK